MALLNPVYAFIVPFLVIFTVPLAIFAGITTGIAFFVLFCRVMVVYLDIALALLPEYLGAVPGLGSLRHLYRHRLVRYATVASTTPSSPATTPSAAPAKLYLSHSRRHSRQHSSTDPQAFFGARSSGGVHGTNRGRSSSNGGSGSCAIITIPSIAPAPSASGTKAPSPVSESRYAHRRRPSLASNVSVAGTVSPASECSFGLAPSVGIERDFEGVGGWRISESGDDYPWTTMHSRLELPDRHQAGHGPNHGGAHHSRTPSAGTGMLTPGDTLPDVDGYLSMRALYTNTSPGGIRGSNISKPRISPQEGLGPVAPRALDEDDGYHFYSGNTGKRFAV